VKREHVVLLGDLKGTKSHLADSSPDAATVLSSRLATIHSAFARRVLEIIDRSRTLHAYCFSDSVLVRWDDAADAIRYAPSLAAKLWNDVHQAGLPFRVFMDHAQEIDVIDDVGQAIQSSVGRYHHVVPASLALWSVFVAEESHFPDGVFVGESLGRQLSGVKMDTRQYEAGPFKFFQMQGVG